MSRKKKHEHVNHERWLVSYADFITLLFAFFVVLFASSQADKKKQAQLGEAIETAFSQMGVFQQHSAAPPLEPQALAGATVSANPLSISIKASATTSAGPLSAQMHAVHQSILQMLKPQLGNGAVEMHESEEGLVISLREAGFFDSGSADVRAATLPVVAGIAHELASSPFAIRIEGHTDNVPIHTARFRSNWELSASRAATVTRIFLDDAATNPAGISAAGYAEYHPIADNSTAEGRAKNRRVDIIVLPRPAPSQSAASDAGRQTPRRTPAATSPGPAFHE